MLSCGVYIIRQSSTVDLMGTDVFRRDTHSDIWWNNLAAFGVPKLPFQSLFWTRLEQSSLWRYFICPHVLEKSCQLSQGHKCVYTIIQMKEYKSVMYYASISGCQVLLASRVSLCVLSQMVLELAELDVEARIKSSYNVTVMFVI